MDAPSLPNHRMFQSVVPRSLRKIFPRISSMWTTLGHSPQKQRSGVRLDPNSHTMDCFDLGLTTLHLNENYENIQNDAGIREKDCLSAKVPSTSDRRLSITTFKLSLLSKVCASSVESCTKIKGTMVEDDQLPLSLLKSPITKDNMTPSVNNNLSVEDLAEGKICDQIIIATPSINKSRKRLKLTQQVSLCGETGKRPGSTSRVPRIGRSHKKLLCKHRLASALNMLTGSPPSHLPLGDETRSLLAEDLPQGHSQDLLDHTTPLLPDINKVNGLQSDLDQEPSVPLPILWNKYLSLDNTCGLLASSGNINNSINRLLRPRSSVPHHLDQIVDAATLPFESGDGRSGPRYQNTFGWSDDHKSPNIVLSQVGKGKPQTTARRSPVAMSTDAVRGSVGLSRGLHVWRVNWPLRHRGTHAVIGIVRGSNPDTTTTYRTDGYRPLIGVNQGSWGWDLVSNRLFDGDKTTTGIVNNCSDDVNHPPTTNYLQSIAVCKDEDIHVVLDMGLDSGTLGYYANGQYMGHAFTSAALKTTHDSSNDTNLIYPIISAVWGHCEIRLEYIDGLEDGPFSLKLLSRYVIRKKTPFLANFKTNYGKCQADIPKDLLEYLAS